MAMITPVDPMDDRAVYKQIADQLRSLLDAGEFRPGDKLPSETVLMQRFGVSRPTIRNGLDELAREGRIYAKRGVGVFVTDTRRLIIHDPAEYLTRRRRQRDDGPRPIAQDALNQGYEYSAHPRLEQAVPSPRVAELLGVGAHTEVFVRERLVSVRLVDGNGPFVPSKIANSYLPLDIAVGRIREQDTGPGGTYARIEEAGHTLTHFAEQLVFRMPDPTETRRLRLRPGVPVIDQTRVAYSGGRPVECFLAVLAGDKHQFEYRIPVNADTSATEHPRPLEMPHHEAREATGRHVGAEEIIGSVDPDDDRPVYKQIADLIRDRIDDDALVPGDRLPSEAALMRRFEVTRTTIRRAITTLVDEGRVRTERGVGAFVKEVVLPDAFVRQPYDRLARHHYRDEGISPLWIDAATRGLEPDDVHQDRVLLAEVDPPPPVAACLQLDPGTKVFRRRRRIRMGDLPTQLTDTYLPLDIAVGALREEHTGPGGTHARIEEAGHHLTHFVEHLSVRMPYPEETRQLRLDDGVPVVDLYQTAYANERPVECFVSVIAGDRYVFTYRIDAD